MTKPVAPASSTASTVPGLPTGVLAHYEHNPPAMTLDQAIQTLSQSMPDHTSLAMIALVDYEKANRMAAQLHAWAYIQAHLDAPK